MQQSSTLAVRAPVNPRCATRTLALTTTNATTTLPAGGYELVLDSAAIGVIGHGVATTGLPSSTETAGISIIPAGGAAEHVLDADTVLNARVLSGTGTLYIVRKAEV